jgi:hypothetical protein
VWSSVAWPAYAIRLLHVLFVVEVPLLPEQADRAARHLEHAAGDTLLEAQAWGKIGTGTFHGPAPWTEVGAFGRAALAQVERLGAAISTHVGTRSLRTQRTEPYSASLVRPTT